MLSRVSWALAQISCISRWSNWKFGNLHKQPNRQHSNFVVSQNMIIFVSIWLHYTLRRIGPFQHEPCHRAWGQILKSCVLRVWTLWSIEFSWPFDRLSAVAQKPQLRWLIVVSHRSRTWSLNLLDVFWHRRLLPITRMKSCQNKKNVGAEFQRNMRPSVQLPASQALTVN